MSFTRFRKSEKNKEKSIHSNQEYPEYSQQKDNLSQLSNNSKDQYYYKQNEFNSEQKKTNQGYNFHKFNNNINNLQNSENNSKNPSISSSSSNGEQYICNNCINDALIYEKQLNAKTTSQPKWDDPMDMQNKLGALERQQINNKINERMELAIEAGKQLGQPTNKDKLIQENEKGTFFLDYQQGNPQMKKVLDNYNRNDIRNRGQKPFFDKPGVDDYYRNYVDNYKDNLDYYDYDENDKKNAQKKYNKDLRDQIEANKRYRNKFNLDDKKYNEELRRQDDLYLKEQEEEAKRIKDKQNEIYRDNMNIIEAKKKKAQNDKMLDEYDQKRNASNIKRQMEDEAEKLKREEEEKRKGWQKALENQINEKKQLAQREKDYDKMININKFTHEDHECCQNAKCCICKRIYPLSLLNPKKKYASLARIQKMRKQKEIQKKGMK